ncbi:hypothetical protein BO83DRAFT_108772 [Aspergillus eucalypticola CBS 122712]|uniref:Uncharacterized protein n=1 Tax=Aspergillus eucalypticola (strain CBS 122712 / IBT 29274) TaxID=1448314 RepID=A0A317UZ97_ASPEC|nr:uncharacterized protein BO83DRAFT_108772 [Aspergillus eucalypticola CBS 122712]PWY66679.1 hypothetical protein BO83DRAFT_108772 [Aspergillus eucalypticola CBS 122712]
MESNEVWGLHTQQQRLIDIPTWVFSSGTKWHASTVGCLLSWGWVLVLVGCGVIGLHGIPCCSSCEVRASMGRWLEYERR